MWLLERLAGHIERRRVVVASLLELSDSELIAALGGRDRERLLIEYQNFGEADARRIETQAAARGLELACRCDSAYPAPLNDLEAAAPAVLAVNGGMVRLARLCGEGGVAIVGTRRASAYGQDVARNLGRDLSVAGITVISGMAYGIDSAAHEGALEVSGRTVAVLSGAADCAYPKRKSSLYRRILEDGLVLSELGLAGANWRWAMQARNRVIAALAKVTVLVEAPEHSGAMITAHYADTLERYIGVIPAAVTAAQSAGTNLLLAKARAGRYEVSRSRLWTVRDAQDVLDLIYGEGIVDVPAPLLPEPSPSEAALLAKIRAGLNNVTQVDPAAVADLAGLELKGWVLRGAGGALTASAR